MSLKINNKESPNKELSDEINDLIDLDEIKFESDEKWLYYDPHCTKSIKTISEFLKEPIVIQDDIEAIIGNYSSPKSINTQTFTRPKKKFTRSSVQNNDEEICSNKPLHFDLSQMTTTNYLRNLANNDNECVDDMSLPSLVNSMCSSTIITSDSPRNDLQKICDRDLSTTMIEQVSELMIEPDMNATEEAYHDASDENFNTTNSTFRKSGRLSSATFRKSSPKVIRQSIHEIERIDRANTTETIKLMANTTNRISLDMNTTQIIDNRKSWECLVSSTDSLDQMSSLSGSSRESGKMLDIKEVEAITKKQEKILMVSSTPVIHLARQQQAAWERYVSPVPAPPPRSDSDASSSTSDNDYKSVRSSLSRGSLVELKQTRSAASLADDRAKPKSINTIVDRAAGTGAPRMMPVNLQNKLNAFRPVSTSNLNKIATGLRGSYTSLRPVNSNLPVAPPPINQRTRQTSGQSSIGVKPQAPSSKMSGDSALVRPKVSGLPRPTTGIPRPMSKIPGPRVAK